MPLILPIEQKKSFYHFGVGFSFSSSLKREEWLFNLTTHQYLFNTKYTKIQQIKKQVEYFYRNGLVPSNSPSSCNVDKQTLHI